jgi:Family of unknown function (DUF6527)
VRFTYQPVERLSKQLERGVLYHSEEFEVAALACACGCGHRVTLLVPDSHQVSCEGGMATVRPSISVCDAPCKSHYIITAGEVRRLPAFSDAMASSTMRAQIARHVIHDAQRRSWISRIWATIARAYSVLKSFLGI